MTAVMVTRWTVPAATGRGAARDCVRPVWGVTPLYVTCRAWSIIAGVMSYPYRAFWTVARCYVTQEQLRRSPDPSLQGVTVNVTAPKP